MSSHSVFVVHPKSVNGYQRTVRSLCCALGQDDVFQIVSLVHPGVKMVTKELSRKPDKRLLMSVNGYQRTLRSLCCVLGQDDIFSQSLLSPSRSKDG